MKNSVKSIVKSPLSFSLSFYKKKLKNSVILKLYGKVICIDIKNLNYVNFEIKDIKLKIINYYLENIPLKKSFKDHLINHLYINNTSLHRKTCLIKFLLDNNSNGIKKITALFLSKRDIKLFKSFHIQINKIKTIKPNFTFLSILKQILREKLKSDRSIKFYDEKKSHFDKNIKYYTLIRDWKLDAEDIHVNKIKKSMSNTIIYLKPDIKGLCKSKKKVKYLEYLRENEQNHFEYYPKVNFYNILKKAVKIYLKSYPNEIKLNMVQILIEREWIDKFLIYIIKKFPYIQEFYTKEEYYTGTTYLSQKLKENNIKTINYAHGLGVYCPIVNYDEFYVFSKMQASYYDGCTKFKYFGSKSPLTIKNYDKDNSIALLFICQNILSHINSNSIKDSYKKIIQFVEKLALDMKIQIFAKYHPLSKDVDMILSKNIQIIDNIEALPKGYNYLALTFYSTYSVDLLNQMPFLILNPNEKVNLQYHFPNKDILYVKTYNELKKRIEDFLYNSKNYYEYWNNLISITNDFFYDSN